MSIESIWKRLESWANSNAPEMLDELQGPATEIELNELEKRLNLKLPDELKQSLRIHNGENDGWPARVFYTYGAYLPVPEIYTTWKSRINTVKEDKLDRSDEFTSTGQQIKPVYFSKKWIPIMDQNGDVVWAIDLDPGKNGVYGQIIEIDWESDSFSVVANSYYDLLNDYVGSLENGDITVELDKSIQTRTQKDLNKSSLDEYFTDDGALEFENYQKQLRYIEKYTGVAELDERDFKDGDEIVLYGTIKPNYETNEHQLLAFFVGTILIKGNLDNLKSIKGNLQYHVYMVKLKISVKKKNLFFNRKEYSIIEYKEVEV